MRPRATSSAESRSMIPKKPVLYSIRGGNRLSETIMLDRTMEQIMLTTQHHSAEVLLCDVSRFGVLTSTDHPTTPFSHSTGRSQTVVRLGLFVAGDRLVAKSDGRRDDGPNFVSVLAGSLPRRFISSSVAVCIKSNSPSLKCLTA